MRNKGNVDKSQIQFKSLALWQMRADRQLLLALQYRHGQSFGREDTNQGSGHLRFTQKLRKSLDGEVFHQSEFNKFQKLNSRILWGGGLRTELFKENFLSLHLGTGVFYESEKLDKLPDQKNPRGNAYLSFLYQVPKKYEVSLITYYQPNTKNFDDYRIRLTAGVETLFAEYFTQSIQFTLARDTFPPGSIKKTDGQLTAGLGVNF